MSSPLNAAAYRADREDLSGGPHRRRILPLTPSTVHNTHRAAGDNNRNGHTGDREGVRQSQQANISDPVMASSLPAHPPPSNPALPQ